MEQRTTTLGDIVPSSAPPSTSIAPHHHHHHQKAALARSLTMGPQSPALRPEDLRLIKPWYLDRDLERDRRDSPSTVAQVNDQSSYPAFSQSCDLDNVQTYTNHIREAMSARGFDAASTRTSSMESEVHPRSVSVPRRACMDLNEAIALLDETCPNPDASPMMTPKTPRTPLTPHPRNKRARSKSSDNSSNYSCEKLNEKPPEVKEKKRPFLKKIGISMTEDHPLLAKFAPRIMGKPYLEKIGPSRAFDKPFLEKIGSSKTLDKFIFDTPKSDKRKVIEPSRRTGIVDDRIRTIERRDDIRGFSTGERRRSGKNFLSKMYSFETEDLEETSLAMKAPHRDPLRGASLDDVLDSGPSSMPRINELCAMTNSDIETPSVSVAELVKCRVTTSEEIISSNSCLNSPMDIISWGNSPRKKDQLPKRDQDEPSNDSVPNSPTKRAHSSITPERVTAIYKDLETVRNGRQASEDILDKRKSRHEHFERRGLSSDNLTKERVATPVFAEIGVNGKGSSTSVVSTTSSIRQEIFTESYAEFKRRTQGNQYPSNALKRLIVRERNISPSFDLGFSSKEAALEKVKSEGSPKVRSKSVENNRQQKAADNLDVQTRISRRRSVLRKQNKVELPEPEQPVATNQRGKIKQEPSQETLNLLSELQKVKSSLKSPSVEKTYEFENLTDLKPFPKKILLTDREFCLSIERENSVRMPSRVNTLETNSESKSEEKSMSPAKNPIEPKEEEPQGPALFEKRCLSLDYVDEEKSLSSLKPEPRTLSLASARSPRSEDLLEASEIALITSDSKSYSSDVFNSPTEEIIEIPQIGLSVEKQVKKIEAEIKNSKKLEVSKDEKKTSERRSPSRSPSERNESSDRLLAKPNNHCSADGSVSPKRRSHSSGESPKATTAFRMKKRLGRISVEETVKQESFAGVDKEVAAVQKKAKCQPL